MRARGRLARHTSRQSGFALLIVLWSMALLALIGTRITASGRAETRLVGNLRAGAVAEAAADGAVFEALFHVIDTSNNHWPADGRPRALNLPQATAEVSVVDESRKITLNNSPAALLRGLLQALGVAPRDAAVLTDQIIDWRSPLPTPQPLGAKAPQYLAAHRAWGPPNRPFRGIDELALVLDMTPEILARLRPYVSPWTLSAPSPSEADPVIAATLAAAVANGGAPQAFAEATTLTIVAVATTPGGGRFVRRAVVRLTGDLALNPGQPPFVVLDWRQEAG